MGNTKIKKYGLFIPMVQYSIRLFNKIQCVAKQNFMQYNHNISLNQEVLNIIIRWIYKTGLNNMLEKWEMDKINYKEI